VSDEQFEPRPAFTIDWPRQFDVGPSDPHLHAIGQFIACYSAVEWKISELFAFFLDKPTAEAQRICVETNMSMAAMIRYSKYKLSDSEEESATASSDLTSTIEAFELISPIRHKIVHWQWGLNEGASATQADLIKPKPISKAKSKAEPKPDYTLTLDELRTHCLKLARIFRALHHGVEVITGKKSRETILQDYAGTSPETPFRP
jgi:hypothetical protein